MALALREQFQARKPKRKYTAIVVGRMETKSGTIRNYLATDADLNRYATNNPEGGELAITHYEVREQFTDASILTVQLETGRRNQIRVHLADAGHPIVGDPVIAAIKPGIASGPTTVWACMPRHWRSSIQCRVNCSSSSLRGRKSFAIFEESCIESTDRSACVALQ